MSLELVSASGIPMTVTIKISPVKVPKGGYAAALQDPNHIPEMMLRRHPNCGR